MHNIPGHRTDDRKSEHRRRRRPGGTYRRPLSLAKRSRYFAEAAAVYAIYGLFRILPLDWASGLGGWIGRTIGPKLAASNKARRNIRNAFPENTDIQNQAILIDMWDNLGRVMAEYPHLDHISHRFEIRGLDILDQLRQSGKPVVAIGGHLANWEIQPLLGKEQGFDMSLVYRKPNNPYLAGLLLKARKAGADTHIPKSMEGAREMVRTLRNGGNLGLLVDQKFNEGIPVPFFGRDAMTFTAPATLGRKFDINVVPVQTERLSGAHFRLTIHPPLKINKTDNADEDIRQTMTRINMMLEDWIRQNPGQWLWLHRRWPDQQREKKNARQKPNK